MSSNITGRVRSLDDWIFDQSAEDRVCVNRFHEIVESVYSGFSTLDPTAPDLDDFRT